MTEPPSANTPDASGGARAPRIWLLLGDKVGDNRQVQRVAEALGLPAETRTLVFRDRWQLGKPLFVPSLFHVDADASDALVAPWPDLILTIGRRPAMAALWIRRQSGNRTRIVLFGRPKRYFDDFDLVVVPAQYSLPERANVVKLSLPLIRLDEARVAAEAEAWRMRLADMPRPLTVVLVGGRTKPFRLDAEVARDLLERVLAEAPPGGSLYVSTSRRTPAEVVDVLRDGLPEGSRLHGFGAAGAENPYLGLLGLGDRFVVTGDSVSMLTEIARLARPLAIYPLPVDASRARGWVERAESHPLGGALIERLRNAGLVGWPRDLEALHALLCDRGWAYRLGDGEPGAMAEEAPADELQDVVQRVGEVIERINTSDRD